MKNIHWVTVQSFPTSIEAQIAASALENAGIESFVRDQVTVGLRPYLANALGGVRVDVPAEKLALAQSVLDVPNPAPAGTHCPRCGAEGEAQPAAGRAIFSILAALISLIPVDPRGGKYRCPRCGEEWRRREAL